MRVSAQNTNDPKWPEILMGLHFFLACFHFSLLDMMTPSSQKIKRKRQRESENTTKESRNNNNNNNSPKYSTVSKKCLYTARGPFRAMVCIGAKEGWGGGGRDFGLHVLQVTLSEAGGNKCAARLDQATNKVEVLPLCVFLLLSLSPSVARTSFFVSGWPNKGNGHRKLPSKLDIM